ncbi:MAG: hypothetical protein IJ811_04355 [Clostridia bacterium]|nr:hypothetical protein [Clostridia bacterium]
MKTNESRVPKNYIVTGIGVVFLGLACLVFFLFFYDAEEKTLYAVICGAGVLIASVWTICMSLWKVTYNDDGTFTYRNFFGKSKTYRYIDVEIKYVSASRTDYLVDGKQVLTIAYYITNGDILDQLIEDAKTNKITYAETNQQTKNEDNFSRQPLMVFGFGLIMCFLGLVLIVLPFVVQYFDQSIDSMMYLSFGIGVAVFLVGVYCMMLYFIWKVCYFDDVFTYRNWFGLKRTYRYDEVSADSEDSVKTTFYHNGKKILVIRYYTTKPDELLKRITKETASESE